MSILSNKDAMRTFELMRVYSNALIPLECLAIDNPDVPQEDREHLTKIVNELREMSSRMFYNEGFSVYDMEQALYELSRDADFQSHVFMEWIDTIIYVASFYNSRNAN